MAKILIGCRLPNGLTITHPAHPKVKVTIAGLHAAKIVGATYNTTEVDVDLWTAWKAVYPDYTPLKTGAIFEARSGTEAKEKAEDLSKEKTGFEPLSPEAGGVKKAEDRK
jgi:hypothetical protein